MYLPLIENQGCLKTCLSDGRFIDTTFNIELIKFLASVGLNNKNQDGTVVKELQILLTISIGISNTVVDSAAKVILPHTKITI